MTIHVINEAKEAPLYHCTSVRSALAILKSNGLRPTVPRHDQSVPLNVKGKSVVCFTRSPKYTLGDDYYVQFVFDQGKLVNNYKIKSVANRRWKSSTTVYGTAEPENVDSFEYEERVMTDKPIPVDKYLIDIRIVPTDTSERDLERLVAKGRAGDRDFYDLYAIAKASNLPAHGFISAVEDMKAQLEREGKEVEMQDPEEVKNPGVNLVCDDLEHEYTNKLTQYTEGGKPVYNEKPSDYKTAVYFSTKIYSILDRDQEIPEMTMEQLKPYIQSVRLGDGKVSASDVASAMDKIIANDITDPRSAGDYTDSFSEGMLMEELVAIRELGLPCKEIDEYMAERQGGGSSASETEVVRDTAEEASAQLNDVLDSILMDNGFMLEITANDRTIYDKDAGEIVYQISVFADSIKAEFLDSDGNALRAPITRSKTEKDLELLIDECEDAEGYLEDEPDMEDEDQPQVVSDPSKARGEYSGPLFHCTPARNAVPILESNMLKGNFFSEVGETEPYICFTTNPDYMFEEGNSEIRFEFDAAKLSRDYSLEDYKDFSVKMEQYEVRVYTDRITNLKDYIINVEIINEGKQTIPRALNRQYIFGTEDLEDYEGDEPQIVILKVIDEKLDASQIGRTFEEVYDALANYDVEDLEISSEPETKFASADAPASAPADDVESMSTEEIRQRLTDLGVKPKGNRDAMIKQLKDIRAFSQQADILGDIDIKSRVLRDLTSDDVEDYDDDDEYLDVEDRPENQNVGPRFVSSRNNQALDTLTNNGFEVTESNYEYTELVKQSGDFSCEVTIYGDKPGTNVDEDDEWGNKEHIMAIFREGSRRGVIPDVRMDSVLDGLDKVLADFNNLVGGVVAEEEPEAAPEVHDELDDMPVAQLKQILTDLGVKPRGTRKSLMKQIRDIRAFKRQSEILGDVEVRSKSQLDMQDEKPKYTRADLEAMSVGKLRNLQKELGLYGSGDKQMLISRIMDELGIVEDDNVLNPLLVDALDDLASRKDYDIRQEGDTVICSKDGAVIEVTPKSGSVTLTITNPDVVASLTEEGYVFEGDDVVFIDKYKNYSTANDFAEKLFSVAEHFLIVVERATEDVHPDDEPLIEEEEDDIADDLVDTQAKSYHPDIEDVQSVTEDRVIVKFINGIVAEFKISSNVVTGVIVRKPGGKRAVVYGGSKAIPAYYRKLIASGVITEIHNDMFAPASEVVEPIVSGDSNVTFTVVKVNNETTRVTAVINNTQFIEGIKSVLADLDFHVAGVEIFKEITGPFLGEDVWLKRINTYCNQIQNSLPANVPAVAPVEPPSEDVDLDGVLDQINTVDVVDAKQLKELFRAHGYDAYLGMEHHISGMYRKGNYTMNVTVQYDNGSLEYDDEQTVDIYLTGRGIDVDEEPFFDYLEQFGFYEGELDLDDVKPTLRELIDILKSNAKLIDDFVSGDYLRKKDPEAEKFDADKANAIEVEGGVIEDAQDFANVMNARRDFVKEKEDFMYKYKESDDNYDFMVQYDDEYDVVYFIVHCADVKDTEFINRVMGNAYKFSGFTGQSIMTLQIDLGDLNKLIDTQIKKFDILVDETLEAKNKSEHAISAELIAKPQQDPEQEQAAKRLEKFARTVLAPLVDSDPEWNSFFIDTPKEFKKYRLKTVGIMVTCYDMKAGTAKLKANPLFKKMSKAKKVVIQRAWQRALDPDGNKCWMCIFIDAEYAKAHGRELLAEKVTIKGEEYTVKEIHGNDVLLEGADRLLVISTGELLGL